MVKIRDRIILKEGENNENYGGQASTNNLWYKSIKRENTKTIRIVKE